MPDFITLDALVGRTAASAPARVAIIDGDRQLSYAELDHLIDAVAAALQADGLAPRDVIAICAYSSIEYVATFLGALRAGVAVAPLAPSSTPTDFAAMLQGLRCQGAVHGRRRRGGDGHGGYRSSGIARRTRRWRSGTAVQRLVRGERRKTRDRRDRSGLGVQHHLFLRHHRHAKGHRPLPLHALAAVWPAGSARLRAGRGHGAVDAAVLQHHAGLLQSDRGRRRHRGADEEVRRPRLFAAQPEASRHPRHAGAGAVSPHHGAWPISTNSICRRS